MFLREFGIPSRPRRAADGRGLRGAWCEMKDSLAGGGGGGAGRSSQSSLRNLPGLQSAENVPVANSGALTEGSAQRDALIPNTCLRQTDRLLASYPAAHASFDSPCIYEMICSFPTCDCCTSECAMLRKGLRGKTNPVLRGLDSGLCVRHTGVPLTWFHTSDVWPTAARVAPRFDPSQTADGEEDKRSWRKRDKRTLLAPLRRKFRI